MIVNTTFSASSSVVATLERDESLSVFAKNRLPAHFKEDFPTFSEFLATYYSFLTSSKSGYSTIESVKDLDAAGEIYLEEMYKTYGNSVPSFEYMGMADFIRNSRKFFSSKGSEDSFKFLFRIMFGVEIDIKYPKENMFSPSSGNWSQKTSIYVDFSSGTNIDILVGKKLLVKDPSGATSEIRVESVAHITGSTYEITYSGVSSYAITTGASVLEGYSATTGLYLYRGLVVPTLNQYEVVSPGSDFNIGSVYSVSSTSGPISFRITGINNNRGIKRIEFLAFSGVNAVEQVLAVGNASIKFKPSAINKYTGFYADTKGFLSDNNKLQDSFFYQIFSYVIKSRVSRELYIDLFNQILHPAGLAVFSENEKIHESTMQLTASALYDSKTIFFDVLQVCDTFGTQYTASRNISDVVNLTELLRTAWTTSRLFSDTVTLSDALSKTPIKGISDTVTLTDVWAKGMTRSVADTVLVTESVSFVITKNISDSITMSDVLTT